MRNIEKRLFTLESREIKSDWRPNQPVERSELQALVDAMGGGDFCDHERRIIAMGERIRAGQLTDDDHRIIKQIDDEGIPTEKGVTTIGFIEAVGRILKTIS